MTKSVTILNETVLSSARFRLTRSLVELEENDGTRRRIEHEIYRHGPAAAVLLYDPGRRVVLLVRQFRLGAYLAFGALDSLEVAAGMLDGDAPDACVRREAMEEAGVHVRNLVFAFHLVTNPACMTETLACFVAAYAQSDLVAAGGGVDDDEWIEIVEIGFDEALALVARGEIRDAKTVALLYYARAQGLI